MKFLYIYAAKSIYDLPWSLKYMGHEVYMFDKYSFDVHELEPHVYDELREVIRNNEFDYVISYLFFARVSDICKDFNLKYISYVYDSPLINLYDKSVANENNYIFTFDRHEYEFLQRYNIPHLYHLPLAANLNRTGSIELTDEDIKKFSCDISFIGSLYSKNLYNTIIGFLSEPSQLTIKTALMKNLCRWDTPKEWFSVPSDVINFIKSNMQYSSEDARMMPEEIYIGIMIFARKLAEMDRLTLLNALAEEHTVDFYTNDESDFLTHPNLRVHSGVDYMTDMNKVFYSSKINLNVTLPSIVSGLPQRIFDIMANGGFVLTNYQPEIDDLFEVGKDIEVFHSLQEAKEKVNYYLAHEDERLRIGLNGYKKVRDNHTIDKRIKYMLEAVERDS